MTTKWPFWKKKIWKMSKNFESSAVIWKNEKKSRKNVDHWRPFWRKKLQKKGCLLGGNFERKSKTNVDPWWPFWPRNQSFQDEKVPKMAQTLANMRNSHGAPYSQHPYIFLSKKSDENMKKSTNWNQTKKWFKIPLLRMEGLKAYW